jgi:putative peptide zinc metalloprotease protein
VSSARDPSTHEFRLVRLRLADGLTFTPLPQRGHTDYRLEEPARSRFYQLGPAEAYFVSLLDGTRSFAQVFSLTARECGPEALTESAANELCVWLLNNGLAQTVEGDGRVQSLAESAPAPAAVWKWNPFWIKVPLLRPDRLVARLLPVCGWVHTLPALLGVVLLATWSGSILVHDWDRFVASSAGILSRDNWLWLGAAWILLKVVHELSHAVACRKHGGEVRELGLVFILLAPTAYVDVTASWRFRSKWERMHVAAAGMYAELIVAALAVPLWSATRSPQAAHLLHNLIVMAGVSTIVFNANPLMRFDGYYILSDLLNLPNLSARGSAAMRRLTARLLTGTAGPALRETRGERGLLLAYGLAAGAWGVLVCVGLMIAASTMFHGAGVVLSICGVLMWWGRPLWHLTRSTTQLALKRPSALMRSVVVAGGLAGAVLATAWLLPDPRGIAAPGVVDFADAGSVRAHSPGFVAAVHVDEGAAVKAGDILFELTNDELASERRDLELAIEQTEVRQRTALAEGNTGLAKIETGNADALRKRLAERTRQAESLVVRAPCDGIVVGRRLQQRLGTYVKEGDELCLVGRDDAKELRLALDQRDAELFSLLRELRVRTASGEVLAGAVSRVEPRASTQAPHDALYADQGGSLPTTAVPEDSEKRASTQLVRPVFHARATLSPEDSRRTPAGLRCAASLAAGERSLGAAVATAARDWVEEQLRRARRLANEQESGGGE